MVQLAGGGGAKLWLGWGVAERGVARSGGSGDRGRGAGGWGEGSGHSTYRAEYRQQVRVEVLRHYTGSY